MGIAHERSPDEHQRVEHGSVDAHGAGVAAFAARKTGTDAGFMVMKDGERFPRSARSPRVRGVLRGSSLGCLRKEFPYDGSASPMEVILKPAPLRGQGW